jgi:hypothetical protein
LLAGVSFAAFEMTVGALRAGVEGFWMPLRMIGAIALSESALNPSFPLAQPLLAGIIVHLTLSVAFAVVFVTLVQPTATIPSSNALLFRGCVFGAALWLVNFYLVAPLMGWQWFPERSNALLQGLAHTFFYGCTLAFLLSRDAVSVHAPGRRGDTRA